MPRRPGCCGGLTEKIILQRSHDPPPERRKATRPTGPIAMSISLTGCGGYYARSFFHRSQKLSHTFDHGRRVELRMNDFIWAIAGDPDTVIAQERHHLVTILMLDFA